MGMFHLFHSVYNLAVLRNSGLILLLKIWRFLNLSNMHLLIPNIPNMRYFLSIICCWVINNSVIFQKKVTKHIWDPCCRLEADSGSGLILIKIAFFKLSFQDLRTRYHQTSGRSIVVEPSPCHYKGEGLSPAIVAATTTTTTTTTSTTTTTTTATTTMWATLI